MDGTIERIVKRRRHLGAQAWREVFERFGAAGVSVGEFCRREGLCRSSFNRWRARLALSVQAADAASARSTPRQPAERRSTPAFVDLGLLGGAAGARAAGSEARSEAAAFELRIELGGGLTLTLARR